MSPIPCDEAGALLAYRPLEVLEDAEALALEAHLSDCAACRQQVDALERAYAPLGAAVSADLPAGLWEAVAGRVEASTLASAGPAVPALTLVLHCAFCHDGLRRPEAVYCAGCLAPHHADCFRAHGRCSAPGCEETHVVRPHEVTPVPRTSRARWHPERRHWGLPAAAGALLLGVGVAAYQGTRSLLFDDPSLRPQAARVGSPVPDAAVSSAAVTADAHDEGARADESPVVDDRPVSAPARPRYDSPRLIQAELLDVDGGRVLLAAGTEQSLRAGDSFAVWRGSEIVGRLEVEELGAETTWAKLVEGQALVGDTALLAGEAPVTAPPLSGLRVYMVEGPPRWTFRYVKGLLLGEGAALDVHLTSADPGWADSAPGSRHGALTVQARPLARLDQHVVIVGETDAVPADLADWVRRGGGLILVPGSEGLPAALRELSPVRDQPLGDGPAAGEAVTQVADHPAVAALSAAVDGRVLPALTGVRPGVLQADAGRVLASYGDRPLLAVRELGRGRVVYVGADDLWRWRRVTGVWRAVWLDLIDWAAGSRTLAPAVPDALLQPGDDPLREVRERAQQGEHAAALRLLETLAEDPEALALRGQLLALAGEHDAAQAALDRAVELDPGLAEAYFWRGYVFQTNVKDRQLRRALAEYSRALALNPDDADALFQRAAASYDLRLFESCLMDLERAARLRAQGRGSFPLPHMHYVRASAAYALELWAEARDHYQAYLREASPGDDAYAKVKERVAELEQRVGSSDAGEQPTDEDLIRDPTPERAVGEVLMFLRAGERVRVDDQVYVFRRFDGEWIDLNPVLPDGTASEGLVRLRPEAIRALERVETEAPEPQDRRQR